MNRTAQANRTVSMKNRRRNVDSPYEAEERRTVRQKLRLDSNKCRIEYYLFLFMLYKYIFSLHFVDSFISFSGLNFLQLLIVKLNFMANRIHSLKYQRSTTSGCIDIGIISLNLCQIFSFWA